MKAKDITISINKREPNPNPIADALQVLPGTGSVSAQIGLENGIVGQGEVYFGRINNAPEALTSLIEHELKQIVLDTDVELVRETHGKMLAETEYHGSSGLATFGIALLDTALWDCLGKSLGAPCWKLWGAAHTRIPAYAMIGWINYDDEMLKRVCLQAIEQGFRGIKIKVGSPTLKEDLHRIDHVRSVVGDTIDIMVDANQALTPKEAIRRGREFQDRNCIWFEEPLPATHIDGYVRVTQALDIPIATGENLFSIHDFARFFQVGAIDIVQPDLRRSGGPTALLQIGFMANSFRIPYASHGGSAPHLNVLACLPNTIYLETGLISEGSKLKLEDGYVELPQGPGFDWE